MKKESTAVIKLTKSEIESVIIALTFTQQSAEFFKTDETIYWKVKHDFIQIKNDIIQGEKDFEIKNKTKEEDRNGPKACESCSDWQTNLGTIWRP